MSEKRGKYFLALDSNDNCEMPRHYCTKYRSLSELIFDLVDVRGTWCLFSAHPLSVSGQASPWTKNNINIQLKF